MLPLSYRLEFTANLCQIQIPEEKVNQVVEGGVEETQSKGFEGSLRIPYRSRIKFTVFHKKIMRDFEAKKAFKIAERPTGLLKSGLGKRKKSAKFKIDSDL